MVEPRADLPVLANAREWIENPNAVELPDQRTPTSKVFLHPGGVRTHVFSTAAIHYYNNTRGRLEDIELGWQSNPGAEPGRPAHSVTRTPHPVHLVRRAGKSYIEVLDGDSGEGIRYEIPGQVLPTPAQGRAQFTRDGLTWAYRPLNRGLKLEATVTEPQGPKTYSFNYEMIGLDDVYPDGEGNLIDPSGTLIVPRAHVEWEHGFRLCGPWRISAPGVMSFDFDDTSNSDEEGLTPRPVEFPYTLDPTTTFAVTSANDKYVQKSDTQCRFPIPDTVSAITGPTTTTLTCSFDRTSTQCIDNLITLKWDTSSLPDTGNTYTARVQGYVEWEDWTQTTLAFNIQADWYVFADAGGNYVWDITSPNAIAPARGLDLGDVTLGLNTWSLDNANSNISRTGMTGVRINLDKTANLATPSSLGVTNNYNGFEFASQEDTTNQEPRLLVDTETAITGTGAIASAEAFGSPSVTISRTITGAGAIGTVEAFGTPAIRKIIQPTSILSEQAFENPVLGGAGIVNVNSIAGIEVFGSPTIVFEQEIWLDPLYSAEEFGWATVRYNQVIGVWSIDSEETIPAPYFPRPQTVTAAGNISSAQAFGTPAVGGTSLAPEDLRKVRRRQALMLAGERGEIYYQPHIFLSNINGDELAEMPGVITATVSLSNFREHTWEIQLQCEKHDEFDPQTDYLLAALDVSSDMDDWTRFYLGLYRFELPQGTDLPHDSFWDLVGFSIEWLLDTQLPLNGWSVSAGTKLFTALNSLLSAVGIPSSRLTRPPESENVTIPNGVKWDAVKDSGNSTYLTIFNDLLRMCGFDAVQTSNIGQLFFEKSVELENRHPDVYYGPPEDNGDDMILYGEIPRKVDYTRFANEVYVYNSNTAAGMDATVTPITALAQNNNVESPVSIQNLGYRRTKIMALQDIASQSAANTLARAELSKSTAYYIQRTISTMPDPRRGPGETYFIELFNDIGMPMMDGKFAVINWSLPLSQHPQDMVMTHELSRVEGFD